MVFDVLKASTAPSLQWMKSLDTTTKTCLGCLCSGSREIWSPVFDLYWIGCFSQWRSESPSRPTQTWHESSSFCLKSHARWIQHRPCGIAGAMSRPKSRQHSSIPHCCCRTGACSRDSFEWNGLCSHNPLFESICGVSLDDFTPVPIPPKSFELTSSSTMRSNSLEQKRGSRQQWRTSSGGPAVPLHRLQCLLPRQCLPQTPQCH